MEVKSQSEVVQSCPTLSDPMDCSLPGSSIHGILQARVLEWGAIAFSDHLTLAPGKVPDTWQDLMNISQWTNKHTMPLIYLEFLSLLPSHNKPVLIYLALDTKVISFNRFSNTF